MRETSSDRKLDDIDLGILRELQANSRISNVELAQRVDLSPPAVHTRIRRLESLGYVSQYTAILDREKLGYDMMCFIGVSLEKHHVDHIEAFRDAVRDMPEVLECHFVTGEYDYLLKIAVCNRKELEVFLMERLTPLSLISRINTSLVLTEIKNTTQIPVSLNFSSDE